VLKRALFRVMFTPISVVYDEMHVIKINGFLLRDITVLQIQRYLNPC